jgi:hypothetical protein
MPQYRQRLAPAERGQDGAGMLEKPGDLHGRLLLMGSP